MHWFAQNALVHYLSPRGIEQFSGGGWGVRDVCQGAVETLLTLGEYERVREVLERVYGSQGEGGEWVQWFCFFERDKEIRAGDVNGDVIFWPLKALADYLEYTHDLAFLHTVVPFYTSHPPCPSASIWTHVVKAIDVVTRTKIDQTSLPKFGGGDWNDSLQPVLPSLRTRLVSSWTVTLQYQTWLHLSDVILSLMDSPHFLPEFGTMAMHLKEWASQIRDDFHSILLRDGIVAGYSYFHIPASFSFKENEDETLLSDPPFLPLKKSRFIQRDTLTSSFHVSHLLHPSDTVSGVQFSALPMIHGILSGIFTKEEAERHLKMIGSHLLGPDGCRLFDTPLQYEGGRQRIFQRAESSPFFGREIGLCYTHAHLRYVEALSYFGLSDLFFSSFLLVSPPLLQSLLPSSDLRQANCYYTSSDAAFSDRYAAKRDYSLIWKGGVELRGGWRVYSSGPGIAFRIFHENLLGIRREQNSYVFDPVLPCHLNGLTLSTSLCDRRVSVKYVVHSVGVSRLILNGSEIEFERLPNPYRVGAVRVSKMSLSSLLSPYTNTLVIHTGGD